MNAVSASGAILYTADSINPYFGSIAAQGMCLDPARLPQVVAWMKFYLKNLNMPDKWGVDGTIYNFSFANGQATSTNDCDSTDSYAATFLSLAWGAWQTGDATTQAYIKTIIPQLQVIGYAIVDKMMQPDGLTWAKPDYQFKYLMDNCEVWHGLSDLVSLFKALGNTEQATYYASFAAASLKGIMSMGLGGLWAVYKDNAGILHWPALTTFYPDAQSQLFPILHGIVSPTSPEALAVYGAFNAAWPDWPALSFATPSNPFPQCLLGVVAGLMGDVARLEAFIENVAFKYVPSFAWPWYCTEAGWFMIANEMALGKTKEAAIGKTEATLFCR